MKMKLIRYYRQRHHQQRQLCHCFSVPLRFVHGSGTSTHPNTLSSTSTSPFSHSTMQTLPSSNIATPTSTVSSSSTSISSSASALKEYSRIVNLSHNILQTERNFEKIISNFRYLQQHSSAPIHISAYNTLLHASSMCSDLQSTIEIFHAACIVHQLPADHSTVLYLLTALAKNQQWNYVIAILNELIETCILYSKNNKERHLEGNTISTIEWNSHILADIMKSNVSTQRITIDSSILSFGIPSSTILLRLIRVGSNYGAGDAVNQLLGILRQQVQARQIHLSHDVLALCSTLIRAALHYKPHSTVTSGITSGTSLINSLQKAPPLHTATKKDGEERVQDSDKLAVILSYWSIVKQLLLHIPASSSTKYTNEVISLYCNFIRTLCRLGNLQHALDAYKDCVKYVTLSMNLPTSRLVPPLHQQHLSNKNSASTASESVIRRLLSGDVRKSGTSQNTAATTRSAFIQRLLTLSNSTSSVSHPALATDGSEPSSAPLSLSKNIQHQLTKTVNALIKRCGLEGKPQLADRLLRDYLQQFQIQPHASTYELLLLGYAPWRHEMYVQNVVKGGKAKSKHGMSIDDAARQRGERALNLTRMEPNTAATDISADARKISHASYYVASWFTFHNKAKKFMHEMSHHGVTPTPAFAQLLTIALTDTFKSPSENVMSSNLVKRNAAAMVQASKHVDRNMEIAAGAVEYRSSAASHLTSLNRMQLQLSVTSNIDTLIHASSKKHYFQPDVTMLNNLLRTCNALAAPWYALRTLTVMCERHHVVPNDESLSLLALCSTYINGSAARLTFHKQCMDDMSTLNIKHTSSAYMQWLRSLVGVAPNESIGQLFHECLHGGMASALHLNVIVSRLIAYNKSRRRLIASDIDADTNGDMLTWSTWRFVLKLFYDATTVPRVETNESAHTHVIQPTTETYDLLLQACARMSNIGDALNLYHHMKRRAMTPTPRIVSSVLQSMMTGHPPIPQSQQQKQIKELLNDMEIYHIGVDDVLSFIHDIDLRGTVKEAILLASGKTRRAAPESDQSASIAVEAKNGREIQGNAVLSVSAIKPKSESTSATVSHSDPHSHNHPSTMLAFT